ncbi:MAG: putative Dual specificity protein phosphatase CDC14A, partial [Streblomastix strix]
ISMNSTPQPVEGEQYFTTDSTLHYKPFSQDFGPLNISCVFRFCTLVDELLKKYEGKPERFYYYSSFEGHRRANAIFLMTSYMVLYLHKSPEDACIPFANIYPPIPPYRDAGPGQSTMNLHVLDCLQGLKKAQQRKILNFSKFDYEEYEFFDQIDNGELNWIIPNRIMAFCSPTQKDTSTIFDWGITAVVRLNNKLYDRMKFVNNGIQHYELYFDDGSVPSWELVQKFLSIAEVEKGAIAVHCKAGLGRTGTLIACYMIKHYGFTALESIAYIRISRPGSIVGPQQHFLLDNEDKLIEEGELYRKQKGIIGWGVENAVLKDNQKENNRSQENSMNMSDMLNQLEKMKEKEKEKHSTPKSARSARSATQLSHANSMKDDDEDERSISTTKISVNSVFSTDSKATNNKKNNTILDKYKNLKKTSYKSKDSRSRNSSANRSTSAASNTRPHTPSTQSIHTIHQYNTSMQAHSHIMKPSLTNNSSSSQNSSINSNIHIVSTNTPLKSGLPPMYPQQASKLLQQQQQQQQTKSSASNQTDTSQQQKHSHTDSLHNNSGPISTHSTKAHLQDLHKITEVTHRADLRAGQCPHLIALDQTDQLVRINLGQKGMQILRLVK